MEGFDTNVIVRLCVRDDEEQYGRAEAVFRRATSGAGAWLSSVVLAEVSWVLSADFADYLILESARRDGALPLHTFDERLGRSDGAKLVD